MDTRANLISQILAAPEEKLNAAMKALKGTPKRKPIMPKEAAEILGVCRRTLLRYERQGKLTRIQISPRKIRYDANEVYSLARGEAYQDATP